MFTQRWVQDTVKGTVSFHTEANEEPTTWTPAMHENPTWFADGSYHVELYKVAFTAPCYIYIYVCMYMSFYIKSAFTALDDLL